MYSRSHFNWVLASEGLKSGGNFELKDLDPDTWYNLIVSAYNEVGSTIAGYQFETLKVKGKAPEIISVPRPIDVLEEGTMNIVCASSGVPAPSISWSINETVVNELPYITTKTSSNGTVESRINVSHIRSNEAGIYKCEASNDYGTEEMFWKVYVIKRTSVEIFNEGTIRAKAGQSLTLPCNRKGIYYFEQEYSFTQYIISFTSFKYYKIFILYFS